MDTGVTLASPDSITTPSLVPDEGQGDPFCHLTAEPREPGLRGAGQEVDPTDGWDTSQGAKTGGLRGEETWWTVRATPGGDVRNLQDVRSSPPCLEPGGGSVTSLYCCSVRRTTRHELYSRLGRNKINFRRLWPDRRHSQTTSRRVKSYRLHLPTTSRTRHQVW